MKLDQMIVVTIDPVKKTFQTELAGQKGQVDIVDIIPSVIGQTPAEIIRSFIFQGVRLSLGIEFNEIKTILEAYSMDLQDYVNDIEALVT